MRVMIQGHNSRGQHNKTIDVVVKKGGETKEAIEELTVQKHRISFVRAMKEAMREFKRDPKRSEKMIEGVLKEMERSEVHGDKRVKGMIEDVKGQVREAISREDWFMRWGRHFMPSLIAAHLHERCVNFKDPGVQQYGGRLFNRIRDEIDDMFIRLPPPTPSLVHTSPTTTTTGHGHTLPTSARATRTSTTTTTTTSAAAANTFSMSTYYCRDAGCFGEGTKVRSGNGSVIGIEEVKKGDELMTSGGDGDGDEGGKVGRVICVVKREIEEGSVVEMCELRDGVLITPWHPVNVKGGRGREGRKGEWCFPNEVKKSEMIKCKAVYNVCLDRGHVILLVGKEDEGGNESGDGKERREEIEAVTLGHGFKGDVREHGFWGSEAVIRDLEKCKGWEEGRVVLTEQSMRRDENTGLVCGINPNTTKQDEKDVEH